MNGSEPILLSAWLYEFNFFGMNQQRNDCSSWRVVCTCVCVCMCLSIFVCIDLSLYLSLFLSLSLSISLSHCMYVCMYVCVCACMCACESVYMCVNAHSARGGASPLLAGTFLGIFPSKYAFLFDKSDLVFQVSLVMPLFPQDSFLHLYIFEKMAPLYMHIYVEIAFLFHKWGLLFHRQIFHKTPSYMYIYVKWHHYIHIYMWKWHLCFTSDAFLFHKWCLFFHKTPSCMCGNGISIYWTRKLCKSKTLICTGVE